MGELLILGHFRRILHLDETRENTESNTTFIKSSDCDSKNAYVGGMARASEFNGQLLHCISTGTYFAR